MPFVPTTVKVLLATYGTYVSYKILVAVLRMSHLCNKNQATSAGNGRNASRKHSSNIFDLPDDLMYVIFEKLEFMDKVSAGLVCKHWEQLLRANAPAARQWVVDYNVDRLGQGGYYDWVPRHSSLVILRCADVLPTRLPAGRLHVLSV
jgi:hypothetical protein